MFVLEVDARTARPEAVRERVLAWPAEVGVHATGWLGSTGGVSPDGHFLLLMRFASQEAAWITSDLPSNQRWWEACRGSLETEPAFQESTEVIGILRGGSDDAAAVVVTRGAASPLRMRENLRRLESLTADERAGLIGGIVAWHGGERFTEILYASARPEELRRLSAEPTPLGRFMADVSTGAQEIDLDDPWLLSPATHDGGESG